MFSLSDIFTESIAMDDPTQCPSSISGALDSSGEARSSTEEISGGGNRALKRFSAALKGVHPCSMFAGRFLVALRNWRSAFL